MKENEIGLKNTLIYKALSFIYEKKRDFIKAQRIL